MATNKVNKSQAVRDYLKAHPEAKSGEIADALTKQGIKITPGHVANIKTKLKNKKRSKRLGRKRRAAEPATVAPISPVAAATAIEKPARPTDAITLEQIKAVGQMVKSVGGFRRFREMLDVIRRDS
jgi:hypothetical protein